jgi:hypothetical protein
LDFILRDDDPAFAAGRAVQARLDARVSVTPSVLNRVGIVLGD